MKRALLVIDVQNEYFFGKLPVSYPTDSFVNILQSMDVAVANGISVAVVQHTAKLETSPVFRKNTPEWSLHPEVEKRHRDTLIEKNWPDSFMETNLGPVHTMRTTAPAAHLPRDKAHRAQCTHCT